jgi:pyruvate kinase
MSKKIKIIATIGLATKEKDVLREMIKSGMDYIRLNFSHGTYSEHSNYIQNIKELNQELNTEIKIIADLSGPRMNTENGHSFNSNTQDIVTAKDIKDLEFVLKEGVDLVAMSYISSAEDVSLLRNKMQDLGKVLPIIAKIERKLAYYNIDEIIKEADMIMIARGDLGNEVPLEQIPFIEKDIINRCNQNNKLVIVATQMMLSMTENNIPTRAEVTDVTYAILSGADFVMLSEETAKGKYPVEAVKMMYQIIVESTKHI